MIPVILRPVDWGRGTFQPASALPRDGEAVTLWDNQDAAFTDIARGIREVVEELNQT